MSKITNIKITKKDILSEFKKENTKISKNISKIKKELNYDIKDFLPPKPIHEVEFIIKKTYSGFASAIRRTLISEMPVWTIVLDSNNFETNDEYIRFDDLNIKIISIPIHQTKLNELYKKNNDIDVNKIYKFYLHVKNTSINQKDMFSTEIKLESKDKSHNDISKFIYDKFSIQILRPKCYIKTNLYLERGFGYQKLGGSKFSAIPMPHYYPLDHIPLEIDKNGVKKGISSLEVNPTEFYFKYETYVFYKNPLDIIILCIDELIRRVKNVESNIINFHNSSKIYENIPKDLINKIVMYKNNEIEIRKENYTYIFDLYDESTTISKLISQWIHINNNVELITDSSHHPTTRSCFIKIQDKNYIQLMLQASKKIINNLEAIKSQFVKFN